MGCADAGEGSGEGADVWWPQVWADECRCPSFKELHRIPCTMSRGIVLLKDEHVS